jgi:transposase
LHQANIRFQQRTLQRVLAWAAQAAPGDIAADQHHRIALALYDDRQRKSQEIHPLEREIAGRLAQTPYILLLSFPGINVVSAADCASEMGPVEHYANAKAITGRAGLRPSRYQSDQVDKANGPLVRPSTRALRDAMGGPGQGAASQPRQGGVAVLPHRLPDGGRPAGVPASEYPGAASLP